MRETDTVSRHGGDEFLILLAEMAHPADAAIVAEKVNAALGAYSQIDDHAVRLTASIGISVYPEDGVDAKTLIDRADTAMYLAKKQAAGRVRVSCRSIAGSVELAGTAGPVRSISAWPTASWTIAEQNSGMSSCAKPTSSWCWPPSGLRNFWLPQRKRGVDSRDARDGPNELSNPFTPIRLAAATLGRPDAGMTLLPRVQAIIEQQVDKMSRLVEFGVARGEIRDDVDVEMMASMLDWVAERFQDALGSEELDPGLVHRQPFEPERRATRIREFLEVLRSGISRPAG